MSDIPNLDGLSREDVYQYADVFAALAKYCIHKGKAMRHRELGVIDFALYHEKECDHIYKKLPDWARW